MARPLPRAPADRPLGRQLRAGIAARLGVPARAARAGPAFAALLLACVAGPEARAQGPCADVTPPELEITSPARGATLEQGGTADDVVVVSGVAEDLDGPLVSLVVAGQELLAAPADGAVPFAVPTTSRWGLTIVTASAQDACGNRTERAQSFLRSGAYFAAPDTAGPATVGGALALRAGQQLLDDADRSDLDDLASLADAELDEVDWNDTLPQVLASDPLRSGCACSCRNPGGCLGACCPWDLQCPTWADTGYTVSRGTVSASGIDLASLQSNGAGVESRVEVDTLELPLAGSASLATCVAGAGPVIVPAAVSGTVTGSGLFASGRIVPSVSASGVLQTSVEAPAVGFGELEASLECGTWEFLCDARDAILNQVLDLLEDLIADELANVLGSQLEPLFNDFLGELRLDPTLVLPPPLSVTIDADSRFDLADTSTSGVDLGLAVRLQPSETGASIPPGARGAIRRDGAPPADPADGRALGIALKDDLVNQLFWATWAGGGLDLPDLRAEALAAGYEVESLAIQAHLPPVGRSGGAPDQAEIGFGDVFVELTVDLGRLLGGVASGPLDVDFWFSAFLDGRFAVSPPERLRFDVEGVRAESEIVATNDPLMAELLRPLLDELLAAVAQRLLDDALGALRIPTIDLAATFPEAGVEPGSVLGLAGNTATDRPSADYTRAAGDVAVTVPAPEPGPLAGALAAVGALAAARALRPRRRV